MDQETKQRLDGLQNQIDELFQRRVSQQMVGLKEIKQRHLEANIIFFGEAADIPDGSTEVKAYFATDTGVLYLWNGSDWLSTTFS